MDLRSQISYEARVKISKYISWENFEKTQFKDLKRPKNRSKNKNLKKKNIFPKNMYYDRYLVKI